MALPSVLQHLQDSRNERPGALGKGSACPHLNSTALDQAERWISRRRSAMERAFDRLGDFLKE
ncbi:hypothetical protein [Reyranella massiliensis]|uniref:hypothetical protein n=1 Tax=Reyranella massiliensis TaxID=445220 RepID=UPI0002E66577|nr:hypothetical protein [Reyranella massiliensis]